MTRDVLPDPKPERPVSDPELLRRLSPLWQEYGCACCGITPAEGAGDGYRIELHHVQFRSRRGGDEWSNLLGLCGPFLNDCHGSVHRYVIVFKENDKGMLVWMDTRPGGAGWQIVRQLPDFLDSEGDSIPSEQRITLPGVVAPAQPEGEAVERHMLIGELLKRARRDRLAASLLLLKAWEDRDCERLGITWPDYYAGLELQKFAVTKMLAVARTFRGQWLLLPESSQDVLSVETLYEASKLVKRGEMDAEAALDEAIAHPRYQLRAKVEGSEPAAMHQCSCGNWHVRGE